MNNYKIKIPTKTKFLNLFRKSFTNTALENILVHLILKRRIESAKKLIPPDYLYKENSLRIVERGGIKLKLDISNVVDHYIYFGIKDAVYDSISDEIAKANIILDIGANIGTTSLYFASLNPKAKIFAFEPHPHTFDKAVENIKLNVFTNIQLIALGIGEYKDTVKLYEVNKHNPGMNRIGSVQKDMPYKSIEIDSLDNVVLKYGIKNIDLIKLDVEGFEYSVLKGAEEALSFGNPTLFIELDDENLRENDSSAKDLILLLNDYGYSNICRADNSINITSETSFDKCHYDIIATKKT